MVKKFLVVAALGMVQTVLRKNGSGHEPICGSAHEKNDAG